MSQSQNRPQNKAQNKHEKTTHEIVKIDSDCDQVVCDGGGGPLGHPQVWYSFDGRSEVNCFYCGRKFIKQQKAA